MHSNGTTSEQITPPNTPAPPVFQSNSSHRLEVLQYYYSNLQPMVPNSNWTTNQNTGVKTEPSATPALLAQTFLYNHITAHSNAQDNTYLQNSNYQSRPSTWTKEEYHKLLAETQKIQVQFTPYNTPAGVTGVDISPPVSENQMRITDVRTGGMGGAGGGGNHLHVENPENVQVRFPYSGGNVTGVTAGGGQPGVTVVTNSTGGGMVVSVPHEEISPVSGESSEEIWNQQIEYNLQENHENQNQN